jgi:tRNA pseudouridine55 synthase
VVAKLRGLLKGLKIGHAGTLDPAATGVLPVLVGRGTRVAEYLMEWEKEYDTVLRLGETTDTQDATGTVLVSHPIDTLVESRIRAVVGQFKGSLTQLPPMYSAVKVGGMPLYKAARSGRTVARDARQVTIHHIEVIGMAGRDISLRVVCSKGTYIRTLCADIGEALGVGGHVLALERRRVGPLMVMEALTIEALIERLSEGHLAEDLLPLDAALSHLPEIFVDEKAASRMIHGVPVPWMAVQWERSAWVDELAGRSVRLKDPTGRLMALGRLPVGSDGSTSSAPGQPSGQSISIVKVLVSA